MLRLSAGQMCVWDASALTFQDRGNNNDNSNKVLQTNLTFFTSHELGIQSQHAAWTEGHASAAIVSQVVLNGQASTTPVGLQQ